MADPEDSDYHGNEKYEKDSLDFTPEQGLLDALNDIQKGRYKDYPPSKMLILFLWDEPEGTYKTNFQNCGMTMSECVALMVIQQKWFIDQIMTPRGEDED